MSADKVSLLHEVEDLRITCAHLEQKVRSLKENLAVEKAVAEGHCTHLSQDLQEARTENAKMQEKLQEARARRQGRRSGG